MHLSEFDSQPLVTHLHLLLALAMTAIIPTQCSDGFRNRHLEVHRMLGRIFIGAGLICAVTGLILGVRIPFGGRSEPWIAGATGGIFIVSILKALAAIRSGHILEHRKWMMRGAMAALSVASMRILDTILFPFHPLPDRGLFSLSLLLALGMNLLIAEHFIRQQVTP